MVDLSGGDDYNACVKKGVSGMGYPYEKRYLETLQLDPRDCDDVRIACRTLIDKKRRSMGNGDYLSFPDMMYCLGEAMEYESYNLDSVMDMDRLFGDVLLCLLDLEEYVRTTSVVKFGDGESKKGAE